MASTPVARVGQYGGQLAVLLAREVFGVDAKVMLRRGLCAKHPFIPFGAIEVHLKDPLLGPQQLNQPGKPGFEPFAQPTAARPQKQVFRHLLAQRAGAAHGAALFVMHERRPDRAEVKAPVLGEFLIFARNHRDFQLVGDVIPGPPAALQVNGLAVEPRFNLAFDHQRSARRRHPAENQHQQRTARCKPQQGFKDAM